MAIKGNLVERLRGKYRVPITDGLGATGGGDEPDNPNEFVRTFETPPIQHEAAEAIESLSKGLKAIRARAHGVFDDPDLMSMGPLGNRVEDIIRFADATLAAVEGR